MIAMVMVFRYGLMVPSTKVNGLITKQRARVLFGTQKEMSMRESSKMIRLTATASTLTSMAVDTKATGRTICKMVMVLKYGVTGLAIQATTRKGRNRDMGSISGSMHPNMKAIGSKIE
jgi:hypothetical protein